MWKKIVVIEAKKLFTKMNDCETAVMTVLGIKFCIELMQQVNLYNKLTVQLLKVRHY